VDGGRVGESPSSGDLLSGTALVLRNAREWLSEAKVIYAHEGNNGHVVALACIALEEGAKAFLWLLALTEPEPRARKQILGRAAREHGFRMDVALGLAAAAWMTRHQTPTPPTLAGPRGLEPQRTSVLMDYFHERVARERERERARDRTTTSPQVAPPDARTFGIIRAGTMYVDRGPSGFVTPEVAAAAIDDSLPAFLSDANDVLELVERFRTSIAAAAPDERRRIGQAFADVSRLWREITPPPTNTTDL